MENIQNTVLVALTNIIYVAIVGLVAWLVYNNIAWHFNLAPLNYWVCAGAVLVAKIDLKVKFSVNIDRER